MYYGMADRKIGRFRLQLPESLPVRQTAKQVALTGTKRQLANVSD